MKTVGVDFGQMKISFGHYILSVLKAKEISKLELLI